MTATFRALVVFKRNETDFKNRFIYKIPCSFSTNTKAAVQTSRIIRKIIFKVRNSFKEKKEALTICTLLPLQPPIFMLKFCCVCVYI